ncbi:MAG: zinc-dependent alcohol dehydrogenase family protein [Leptospirales bacterium]
MLAFEIQNNSGHWELTLCNRPDPSPGDGDVTVKIHSRSLNFRDNLIRIGTYNPGMPLPLIPLSDGVGTIVETGRNVSTRKIGDRVACLFSPNWTEGEATPSKLFPTLGAETDGTLAEYVVLPESAVVSVPEYLTDEEASTLPCAGVTAWNALFGETLPRPGERILIQGTGDVALFALQFARIAGLEAIVLSRSDLKLERAKTLGAATGINTRTIPEWGKHLLDLTHGQGVEHVLELGGEETFPRSLQALRTNGRISVIGGLSGFTTEINLVQIIRKTARLTGLLVGSKISFESMNRALETHRLKPVIDRVFSFTESLQAYEHKLNGNPFGKIVIRS